MGVMESDLISERNRWQELLLTIRKLPERKRDRVFRMLAMLQLAECHDEAYEIATGIAEIVAKATGQIPRGGRAVDLESGVSDETKEAVAAYHSQIGIAIRKRRDELNMTQEQLAEKAGLPQSHISRLEVGKHTPTRATIEKIAAALDTEPSKLDLLYH